MALAGPPAEQTFGLKVCYSRKSATSIGMSRAGSVMLGARIVVQQSSLVNETHLVKPKSLVCNSRFIFFKSWVRVGSRTSIQDQVGLAENFSSILRSRSGKGSEPLL